MPSQSSERYQFCYESGRFIGKLEATLEVLKNVNLDLLAKTHSILAILSHLTDASDLPNANRIQASISKLKEKLDIDPTTSPWTEADIEDMSEVVSGMRSACLLSYAEEIGEIKSKHETSKLRRNEAARKMDVVRRVREISKQTEQDFFHLAMAAKEVELNAAWTVELSDLSDDKLASTIRDCRAMGDEAFKKHLTEDGLKALPRLLKRVTKDAVLDYKPKSKKAPDTKSGAAKAVKQP
jgi:hypothetical protein